VLTSEIKEPRKFNDHFESSQSQFVEKEIAFFKRKEAALKSLHMDSSSYFFSQLKLVLKFLTALFFENKKSHTIREDLAYYTLISSFLENSMPKR